jgi:hypothetical protein
MSDRRQVENFWRGEKAARISYPVHRGRWPDEDTQDILRRLCGKEVTVCEVGCGVGRCSDAFSPELYVGLDINRRAIEIAREECPDHEFRHIGWDDPYPSAEAYLFYTTLQHIPDAAVPDVLRRCCGRVVVQEHMLREYRDERKLRFHRTPDEYRDLFEAAGFEVTGFEEHPTRYQVNAAGKPPLVRRFLVAEER